MTWRTVISTPNALGESPFWHPDEQALYWIDILARQILRSRADDAGFECWDLPHDPGCIAPMRGGGLVVALRTGVFQAAQWKGALTQIAAFDFDTAVVRFNDGKCDALGRLWAGTIYEPRGAPKAELFSVDARAHGAAQVVRQANYAVTANGLAWSPDGATMYWTDTPSHTIRAWDFDVEANTLRRERVFHRFEAKPTGWKPGDAGYGGRPDGGAVDAEGNYYAAMFEGARIAKLAPTGEWLQDIPVPAQCPTMPCFGGAEFKTLYVTTASHQRPPHELEKFPQSGCVFAMEVQTPGLPVNFFASRMTDLRR